MFAHRLTETDPHDPDSLGAAVALLLVGLEPGLSGRVGGLRVRARGWWVVVVRVLVRVQARAMVWERARVVVRVRVRLVLR